MLKKPPSGIKEVLRELARKNKSRGAGLVKKRIRIPTKGMAVEETHLSAREELSRIIGFKAVDLGYTYGDMGCSSPCDAPQKKHYPSLNIYDRETDLDLPLSGKAVVSYKLRSKTIRQNEEGKKKHSADIEIQSIDPIDEEIEEAKEGEKAKPLKIGPLHRMSARDELEVILFGSGLFGRTAFREARSFTKSGDALMQAAQQKAYKAGKVRGWGPPNPHPDVSAMLETHATELEKDSAHFAREGYFDYDAAEKLRKQGKKAAIKHGAIAAGVGAAGGIGIANRRKQENKFSARDQLDLICLDINIDPANKGKFTATQERTGKTTEELSRSKNPLTRKRAIFAQNMRKIAARHREEKSMSARDQLNNIIQFMDPRPRNTLGEFSGNEEGGPSAAAMQITYGQVARNAGPTLAGGAVAGTGALGAQSAIKALIAKIKGKKL